MEPRTLVSALSIAAAAAAIAIASNGTLKRSAAAAAPLAADALSAQIFEQRVYTTAPGKLDALHARFREHTNWLFVKHGMRLIGYWTPVDKADTLIYVLAYPSREARDASWKTFHDDPEWKRVAAESHERAGGTIVTKVESTIMNPTDYSPIR